MAFCNSNLFHHSHPGLAEASPRCVANYRNPYYKQARLWVRWQVLAFRNVAAPTQTMDFFQHSYFKLNVLSCLTRFMLHALHNVYSFMLHMLHGKLFWCIASGTEDTILLCLGWSGEWQSVQRNPSLVRDITIGHLAVDLSCMYVVSFLCLWVSQALPLSSEWDAGFLCQQVCHWIDHCLHFSAAAFIQLITW